MESGPNVHLDALDGLAAAPDTPSKILVMQQPNSTVSFTPSFLQELLSLSPYPAAPTLGTAPLASLSTITEALSCVHILTYHPYRICLESGVSQRMQVLVVRA